MKKILELTDKDAKNIFTHRQVLTAIEKLKNFEWPRYDGSKSISEFIKTIDSILTEEMGSFPTLVRPIEQQKFKLPIFRARELSKVKNDKLITEFSYPPLHVTSMGRCNFPNHPVFYGSNSPLVAMQEVFRESDFREQKLYLSVWRVIPNNEIFYFESFLRSGLTEHSFYNIFDSNLKSNIKKLFKTLITDEQILGMLEYLKFVDNQFTNDQNYSISASLAHRRLYFPGNIGSDIIIYPSVQSKGNNVNLAIHPNFVDNNMRLERIYVVSLNNFDEKNDSFSATFHNFAMVTKNSVLWNNDLTNKAFIESVKKDFGEVMQTKETK